MLRAPKTLSSIAAALKLPPEIVFRAAGLLPPVSEAEAPEEFIIWLQNELRKRGWPVPLAAEYAGLAPYFIERILQDKKQPSFEVARNLAQAFGMSDILMYELAGLIPLSLYPIEFSCWKSDMVINHEPTNGS